MVHIIFTVDGPNWTVDLNLRLKMILKSSIEAFHKYEQIISHVGKKKDLQRSDSGTIERIVFVESSYDFEKEQWYSG